MPSAMKAITTLALAVFLTSAVGMSTEPGSFRASWEAGILPGDEVLVLTFDAQPGVVAVEVVDAELEVRLPAGMVCDSVPDDLELIHGWNEVRVRLNRPADRLVATTWGETNLWISLSAGRSRENSGTYNIGVGDVVSVAVYKNPDLSGDFTVAPDGSIGLPLIGPVPAAGSTEARLTEHLTEILGADYLVNPQVTVTVKSYRSQYVYITGAVRESKRIAIGPGMTMKDVLSEAGVAVSGEQQILLTRTTSGGEVVRITAPDLELPDAPMPRAGDVLDIQEPASVFIRGEVRRAGRYQLRPGMTLMEAISMAEGLTDWANKKNIRILRKEGQDSREINVNLKKVEDRGIADPVLRSGDVIIVKRRIL